MGGGTIGLGTHRLAGLLADFAVAAPSSYPSISKEGRDMVGNEMAPPKLARKELIELLAAEFPEAAHAVGDGEIEEVWFGGARVRRRFSQNSLRPGGTVSGPIMMALADFTLYVA